MAVTTGMVGHRFYDRHSAPQWAAIEAVLPWLKAAVVPPGAPLSALFRLERSATYEVEVPFVEQFRRTGNAAAFARSYTGFFRAFIEPVLRTAFATRHPAQFADEIFARAERLIREHPERYEFHYVNIAALLTRLA